MNRVATSLQVFRDHIKRDPETGEIDASGVISRACYVAWLQVKGACESDLEARRYHRILTNHCSGVGPASFA